MTIIYTEKNGTVYARIPGKSVRKGRKVVKEGDIYLGKAIDKENYIFSTREKGAYRLDPNTGGTLPVPPEAVSVPPAAPKKREKEYLDFGDAYVADALLRLMGYNKVLGSLPCRNTVKDRSTLLALVLYYVLSPMLLSGAETWYRGSFAKLLYPNACLSPADALAWLQRLGDADVQDRFFAAHIQWIQKEFPQDCGVSLECVALPKAGCFSQTESGAQDAESTDQWSSLLIFVLRGSNVPLLFCTWNGSTDPSAEACSLAKLRELGISFEGDSGSATIAPKLQRANSDSSSPEIASYFDLCRRDGKLFPVLLADRPAVYGHLLLSVIAASVHAWMRRKLDGMSVSETAVFQTLRNQKCSRYKTRLTLEEPDPEGAALYRELGIPIPEEISMLGRRVVLITKTDPEGR